LDPRGVRLAWSASLKLLWLRAVATIFESPCSEGVIDDSTQFCVGRSARGLSTKPFDERGRNGQCCGVDILLPRSPRLFFDFRIAFLASTVPSLPNLNEPLRMGSASSPPKGLRARRQPLDARVAETTVPRNDAVNYSRIVGIPRASRIYPLMTRRCSSQILFESSPLFADSKPTCLERIDHAWRSVRSLRWLPQNPSPKPAHRCSQAQRSGRTSLGAQSSDCPSSGHTPSMMHIWTKRLKFSLCF